MKTETVLRNLKLFEDWVRTHEMKGAQRPDLRDDIERGFVKAKKAMRASIKALGKENGR